MTSKGKRQSEIKMIEIEKINILNPRVRNQKIFYDIASNITKVGLKRPITVTPCKSKSAGKDYDLICGQGRIEAFMACGQTHKGYLGALLANARITKYLSQHNSDILVQFQKIADLTSLNKDLAA